MMVPGFSRLVVKGYRRLRDVDLELRPLNVLIGANGVGESSLLDVLDLLAASAGAKLESSLNLLKEGLSADDADGIIPAGRLPNDNLKSLLPTGE